MSPQTPHFAPVRGKPAGDPWGSNDNVQSHSRGVTPNSVWLRPLDSRHGSQGVASGLHGFQPIFERDAIPVVVSWAPGLCS